jgi:hypothetical protein
MRAECRRILFAEPIDLLDYSEFDTTALEAFEMRRGFRGRWAFVDDTRTCLVLTSLWDDAETCASAAVVSDSLPMILAAMFGQTLGATVESLEVIASS